MKRTKKLITSFIKITIASAAIIGGYELLLIKPAMGIMLMTAGIVFAVVAGVMAAINFNKKVDGTLDFKRRRQARKDARRRKKHAKLYSKKEAKLATLNKKEFNIGFEAWAIEQTNDYIKTNYSKNIFKKTRERKQLVNLRYERKLNRINKVKQPKEKQPKIIIK